MNAISVEAAYAGECWACDEAIKPGDRITGVPNQWRHQVCPDPTVSTRPVCAECFQETANNGTCGCEENS